MCTLLKWWCTLFLEKTLIELTCYILCVFYVQKCAHQKCAQFCAHYGLECAECAPKGSNVKTIAFSAHRAHCAHFLYFLCTLAMSTLCTPCTPQAHCAEDIVKYALAHDVFHFPGPRWYKKGGRKLLLASRRSDEQRRPKTAGNISDGLRCCIWRRAENPAKMTHVLAAQQQWIHSSFASESTCITSTRIYSAAQCVGFLGQKDLPLHPRLPP